MADPRCMAFGPIHHYIDGAVLLTCFRNVEGAPDRDERLADDLEKLRESSACVPGAACANWGVCGAAASVGMAYAIIAQNAPLKEDGWSEGQLLVAHLLEDIAKTGSPRCCKRDSRIAVGEAVPVFNHDFGSRMKELDESPTCRVMDANSVCMGPACAYHPDHS